MTLLSKPVIINTLSECCDFITLQIGISAVCWFAVSISLLWLDPLGLLGIRDPLYQLLGWYVLHDEHT